MILDFFVDFNIFIFYCCSNYNNQLLFDIKSGIIQQIYNKRLRLESRGISPEIKEVHLFQAYRNRFQGMGNIMFDTNTIVIFFTASLLLALSPGPDNIYVLTQSMLKGRKAGIMVTLGLCTGLIGHTTAVSLGLAVLFRTSVVVFNVFKYAGVLYLLFLAWKAFTAREGKLDLRKGTETTPWYLYRRGIIMNITNPKVSIFFLAFLPQFTNPSKGSVTIQLVLLGAMFMISALTVFSLVSYFAGLIGEWFLKSRKAEKILNWIAGSIFVALAINVALTRQ